MFDEQWKVLITLPLVFSFKRCLKTHSYGRRLKKNYEQYSLIRINLLQSILGQTVYGEWNSGMFYNLSNAGEQLLMQLEGPANLADCFNLTGQEAHDVSVWITCL